jgi:serine/threonine protein kinase
MNIVITNTFSVSSRISLVTTTFVIFGLCRIIYRDLKPENIAVDVRGGKADDTYALYVCTMAAPLLTHFLR